jgi:hypothetical protein
MRCVSIGGEQYSPHRVGVGFDLYLGHGTEFIPVESVCLRIHLTERAGVCLLSPRIDSGESVPRSPEEILALRQIVDGRF